MTHSDQLQHSNFSKNLSFLTIYFFPENNYFPLFLIFFTSILVQNIFLSHVPFRIVFIFLTNFFFLFNFWTLFLNIWRNGYPNSHITSNVPFFFLQRISSFCSFCTLYRIPPDYLSKLMETWYGTSGSVEYKGLDGSFTVPLKWKPATQKI